jgi:hypothetical protein
MSTPEPVDGPVVVRGHASALEVAAVLASLRRVDAQTSPARYERWRATRLAALNRPISRPVR